LNVFQKIIVARGLFLNFSVYAKWSITKTILEISPEAIIILINVAGGIPALLNKKISISLMIVNETKKNR
jgi:hypothetical protein